MRAVIIILAVALAVVTGAPNVNRILGGSETSISNYPHAVVILHSSSGSGNFRQWCGGTIINNRSVLSAAHCFFRNQMIQWRLRVGSTNAASGGVIHNTARIITHPHFEIRTLENDIAIVHVTSAFSFNNNVRAGNIASASYNLPDNQEVWAIGWGATEIKGSSVDILHLVQIWTINREVCRNRYSKRYLITDNMLCSGWLDVGGRSQCSGDGGSPLLHNNNIVGIISFSHECGHAHYPGVSTFVPRFTNWIVSNA